MSSPSRQRTEASLASKQSQAANPPSRHWPTAIQACKQSYSLSANEFLMRSRSTSFCKVFLWAYDMLRPCPVRGAATLSRQPRNRPVGARASAELVAVPRAPGVEDGVWRQADATLVTDFAINVQLLFLFCFVKKSAFTKSVLF